MQVTSVVVLLGVFCRLCIGQTTQGMISGCVRDELTGGAIHNAQIEYDQVETNTHGSTRSGMDGNYYIPSLPAGSYHVLVRASDAYQAREIFGVQLSVAGYVLLNFDLRPMAEVWERGKYKSWTFRNNTVTPFYGPDIDPSYVGDFEPERRVLGQLEPSISAVIDPVAIADLPLAGRDVYTALVLLPGVSAQGTTTRSLGLSANGQRPSSSNFLVDGQEVNDSLLSGPAMQLAPEMVQEYRVSTNNFSAEYGRTAGYVANVITRSGASAWHGVGYGDLNNDGLNANTFSRNSQGLPRGTSHEIEAGTSLGGKIPQTRIYNWSAFDYFGSRSFSDPTVYTLPTQAFAASLPSATVAAQLLREHPPVQWANSSSGNGGPVSLAAPITLRRYSGEERLDYAFSESQHGSIRVAGEELKRPDFNWSPYGQAPLSQGSVGVVAALSSAWSPELSSEIRMSFLENSTGWDLALADLPQIVVDPTQTEATPINLPGNCCNVEGTRQEGWRERTITTEAAGHLTFNRNAHVLKAGGGWLDVRTRSAFRMPPAATFFFGSLADFAADSPESLETQLSWVALNNGILQVADTDRLYSYLQPYAFLQEDWRVTSWLTFNAGIRYDRFPAPRNIGAVPDVIVVPGSGATFDDQIAGATERTQSGSLFSAKPNNFSLRLAFSAALWKAHGTVLRGGYGNFYDRPFDNTFLTAAANDLSASAFTSDSCPLTSFYQSRQYLRIPTICQWQPGSSTLFDLTMFQPGLRSPRVDSFFVGLQHPLTRNLWLEANGMGSRGRHLLATDIVNRWVGGLPPANGLPNIDDRTDLGFSDYAGLSLNARYRVTRVTLNTNYTWSHSIDNQSDPLLGSYFDLSFSNQTNRVNQQYFGAFSLEGNSRIDRGNSDFDQRQNFVGWAAMELPSVANKGWGRLTNGWTTAAVFAVRSGLPYTVYAGFTNCFPICNTRADLLSPGMAHEREPIAGGMQLLNPNAFGVPANGTQGNTGRNAFVGPGFANVDVSLARTFSLPKLGERVRATLRADLFELLNHPNLQNPEAYLGFVNGDSPTSFNPLFGTALFGAPSSKSGFPSLTPLLESTRQIHLMLRVEF